MVEVSCSVNQLNHVENNDEVAWLQMAGVVFFWNRFQCFDKFVFSFFFLLSRVFLSITSNFSLCCDKDSSSIVTISMRKEVFKYSILFIQESICNTSLYLLICSK